MDNDQGKDGDGVAVPHPADGLRRSSRLRNQLPPQPGGEGGSYSASEMKRPRRQKEEKDPRMEGGDDGDAEDVKVKKVNPKGNVKAVSEAVEVDEEKTGTRERSLSRQQLPRGVKAKVDVILKEEEASSAGIASSGTLRSEVRTSDNVTSSEEGRAPPLESSKMISNGPLGQFAVSEDGAKANENAKDITCAYPGLEPPAALQNSAVLTNLFELCPPAALANFRLVCKEWRDLSLKTWRASIPLRLTRYPDGRYYIVGRPRTALFKFFKYVEDPRNECGVTPFRRIRLRGLLLNQAKPQVERFWTLTGRNVTSLNLEACKLSDADEFWRIPFSLCPNLKRLSLWYCSFVSGQNVDHSNQPQLKYKEPVRGAHEHLKCLILSSSQLPVSWLELLSHFDSLTSLEVKADSWSGPVAESLLNVVKVIRSHDGSKLPLNHFDVQPFRITHRRASHDKFALLQEFNIPLKSLIVRAHPRLDLDVVSDILEQHAGSLQNLVLECGWEPGWAEGKFQCRVQLEKLQDLTMDDLLLESTELLKHVPNLQSLIINGGDCPVDRLKSIFDTLEDGLARFADSTAMLLPKLTELTYIGSFGGRENLVTLAKLMPNVEELVMTLNDEQFSTVCGNWKGLKKIHVATDGQDGGDYLTDKGLTGGSLQIQNPGMKWVHKAVHPNITDLKELKSFSCRSKKLTDVSVYHGFLQLSKLKTVTVYVNDDDEEDDNPRATPKPNCFGEEARKDLQEKGISYKGHHQI